MSDPLGLTPDHPLYMSPEKLERAEKEHKERMERGKRLIDATLKKAIEENNKLLSDPNYVPVLEKVKSSKRRNKDPELVIQASVLKWLGSVGVWAWVTNRKGRPLMRGNTVTRWLPSQLPVGHSDLCGVLPNGRVLFIEVKDKGKKPTPAQLGFIDRVNDIGGVAFWTDDLEKVKNIIKPLLG